VGPTQWTKEGIVGLLNNGYLKQRTPLINPISTAGLLVFG